MGDNIKRLRQKAALSQAQAAKQLGISIPAFCKIETGITDIHISRLEQIAAIFGVDNSVIMQGENYHLTDKIKAENLRLAVLVDEQHEEILQLQGKLIKLYDEISRK